MKIKKTLLACITFSVIACSCGNKTTSNAMPSDVTGYQRISPKFNADSAYNFVQKQVDFGPRVPNTPQHTACGDYLVNELKTFGANVIEQKMSLTIYNGKKISGRNIIGSYGLEKKNRVLLFAHWDTRAYADSDSDKNFHTPILGADDGASGVGILLEVARNLYAQAPEVGIDIIFFDAEDYGTPSFLENQPEGNWWCLGSQYWSKNLHVKGYKAKYGILLDLVGGKDATFCKEYYSIRYADNIVEKIWSTARQLGYGKYFVARDGGAIVDDHVSINQNTGIPSVDIINYVKNGQTESFPEWHHTLDDNMTVINKETLEAVGQTILEVIYKEK